MKVVNHEIKMDDTTFIPQHLITIQISQETIDDIKMYQVLKPSGLDMMLEFRQAYGEAFMSAIIQPLIDRDLKVPK